MAAAAVKDKALPKDWTVFLSVRVPVSLAERIDVVAAERNENRSDYIRDVLERATSRALARAGAA